MGKAAVSPRVGTRETAGLNPENNMQVRTGINTSLPQGAAPASPRPSRHPSMHTHQNTVVVPDDCHSTVPPLWDGDML